jgi:hypothetical protein
VPADGPEVRICRGKDKKPYIAFWLPDGSCHFFTEVEAKAAAKECLGLGDGAEDQHTRDFNEQVWARGETVPPAP